MQREAEAGDRRLLLLLLTKSGRAVSSDIQDALALELAACHLREAPAPPGEPVLFVRSVEPRGQTAFEPLFRRSPKLAWAG
ncbi:uncharacterized protein STAUR_5480 [Stigmatella aurantiaca DW4/3-1]|uniref:Uncharacterized protein n=1 Tax=Stigmatella aurantiaca (strain DW4/3-1) TaxID=378806 RepID=Q094S2_STIAD|nr:uncharacterized protein STAUR_5480 [Stigmatella aurantiaca DW4/3-1]EAU67217.1 hypothetical protein STIAU_7556 [Stigmatella aurantiaca DW4/3-1]